MEISKDLIKKLDELSIDDKKNFLVLLPIEILINYGINKGRVENIKRNFNVHNIGELLDVIKGNKLNYGVYVALAKMGLISNKELSIIEENKAEFLDIAELDISYQLKLHLVRARIDKLKDLLELTSDDILRIRGIGPKSFVEIRSCVRKLGYDIKGDYQTAEEFRTTVEAQGDKVLEDVLNLKPFTRGLLHGQNIYTLNQLLAYGTRVYEIPKMVKGTREDFDRALKESGIVLPINKNSVMKKLLETEKELLEKQKSLMEELNDINKRIAQIQAEIEVIKK